jgi:hypothetical protein
MEGKEHKVYDNYMIHVFLTKSYVQEFLKKELAEALTLLTCISEVPDSNLS